MKQTTIFQHPCLACQKFAHPMHELFLVEYDFSASKPSTSRVWVCLPCLTEYRARYGVGQFKPPQYIDAEDEAPRTYGAATWRGQ